MKSRIGAAAFALALGGAVAASAVPAAAQVSKQHFNGVGTWSFLTNYKDVELPFMTQELPKASGGNITVDYKSITELNLSGFEIVDLTRKGVYDIVAGVLAYVADKSPAIEGIDLTGVAPDADLQIKLTKSYRSVIAREFEQKYGVHLLGMFGYPSQNLFCSKPVASLADLKGRKIRVYGTSLGDFVEGLGGVSVTIAFGEVVPALQKGVADCGITGTLPAYDAKWGEVATHMYLARLGWAPSFVAINLKRWKGLDAPTQKFLTEQFTKFEEISWEAMKSYDQQGINCNTGVGPCKSGAPGKMVLVEPSAADKKMQKEIVEKLVVSRWAKRCGDACVKEWNETIGKEVGMVAKAPN
jgi:TRAP-type C4-dicarboxylate transport system substrate-binding protein